MRRPELRYLAIGRIVKAHGLRGEVSITVLTEFPERFETTEWVYLGNEFEATAYRVESYRWHRQNILLTLAGVTDRTQAEMLRGQFVQVPLEEAVPLPEGSYYLYQLIGLEVKSIAGEFLGVIRDIVETGANDVYVVEKDGQQILLPAIPDVVKTVDIANGAMVVQVIDGLI
ncbi:MAG: 16S rRNA processing protein RimM [Chloroflexi bacterium]|nr:16S rRNA processing protein RimM [Chloroflexota bacterium]